MRYKIAKSFSPSQLFARPLRMVLDGWRYVTTESIYWAVASGLLSKLRTTANWLMMIKYLLRGNICRAQRYSFVFSSLRVGATVRTGRVLVDNFWLNEDNSIHTSATGRIQIYFSSWECWSSGPLRLVAQDIGFSVRRQGFDSPRGYLIA